jgi:4-diphosphocytidyl-2-C-methyl-D-erythritol kinase
LSALRLLAPAKLNLVLRVLGRRDDGYHRIETLFHAIDLCDELRAAPADVTSLVVSADDPRDAVPADDDNLVLRAARAFAPRAGPAPAPRPGFRFALRKRIPNGAGLGGGSSDAAAALRLCNELWGRPLDAAALHAVASRLGADVAFFLRGGSQWGRGIGDELSPAPDVPARHFLLLVPPFACATDAVYENFTANWNAPLRTASIPVARDRHLEDSALPDRFENDLEAAAERVRPELRQLRSRARGLGAGVRGAELPLHMTGSGSALFVPAADAGEVAVLVAALAPLRDDGVRLVASRTLARLPEPQPAGTAEDGG